MNDLLQKKLDELFVELNNSKEIKQLAFFKEEIKKDNELKVLLEEYHNSANYYEPKIIDIKRQIINNPIIKEYRSLEDDASRYLLNEPEEEYSNKWYETSRKQYFPDSCLMSKA